PTFAAPRAPIAARPRGRPPQLTARATSSPPIARFRPRARFASPTWARSTRGVAISPRSATCARAATKADGGLPGRTSRAAIDLAGVRGAPADRGAPVASSVSLRAILHELPCRRTPRGIGRGDVAAEDPARTAAGRLTVHA